MPWLILSIGLACLFIGGDLLRRHFQGVTDRPARAVAGWILISVALLQLRLALAASRRRQLIDLNRFGPRAAYWKWFILGPIICFLLMVLLGVDRHDRYLFRAAIGVWYTIMLLPVVTPEFLAWRPLAAFGRVTEYGVIRRVANGAFAVLLLGTICEGSLRLYSAWSGDWLDAAVFAERCLQSPRAGIDDIPVNSLGFHDEEFTLARRPGVMRVAVIGDETTLTGPPETNFLGQIERQQRGVEMYNFALPSSGPREYLAVLTSQVLAYQPDLVLTCISVGDDVTGRLPTPSHFDWRRLHLVQFVRRLATQPHPLSGPADSNQAPAGNRGPEVDEQERRLQATAGQLQVCRAPLDDRMRRRWSETFSCLEEITAICERHKIATAIVVAPSVPQLDQRLRATLARRAGYRQEEVDIQLPQRQLASFGHEHGVPVIDLYPHFAKTEGAFQSAGCQWSEQGHQAAADAVGTWIARQGATLVARRPGR